MPTNISEWVGFAVLLVNGVLVLGMIVCFALAFLDPFFARSRTWFWKRGGLGS